MINIIGNILCGGLDATGGSFIPNTAILWDDGDELRWDDNDDILWDS